MWTFEILSKEKHLPSGLFPQPLPPGHLVQGEAADVGAVEFAAIRDNLAGVQTPDRLQAASVDTFDPVEADHEPEAPSGRVAWRTGCSYDTLTISSADFQTDVYRHQALSLQSFILHHGSKGRY